MVLLFKCKNCTHPLAFSKFFLNVLVSDLFSKFFWLLFYIVYMFFFFIQISLVTICIHLATLYLHLTCLLFIHLAFFVSLETSNSVSFNWLFNFAIILQYGFVAWLLSTCVGLLLSFLRYVLCYL